MTGLLAASAATANLTNLAITLLGAGGAVGAVTGFIRLRGDRDSQAVSQAQGAIEVMETLQDELRASLKRAQERADYWRGKYDREHAEKEAIIHRWGPFPRDVHEDGNGGH